MCEGDGNAGVGSGGGVVAVSAQFAQGLTAPPRIGCVVWNHAQ